jgi:UDP-N-acetylmuramoyl-L-alanyl-D-glutamate--2,6-diaminopimelate ligase
MRLAQLLESLDAESGGQPDLEVTGLTADSRQVQPGSLFVAIRGTRIDGHQFLAEAVKRGAVALVGEEADPALGVPYIRVSDSRRSLALLAAAWNGFPARKLVMIGVTGTDGKTTTVNFIYRILRQAGLAAGMISTVNAMIGERAQATGLHVTTPSALEVQGYLREMVEAGLTHCVLEATSHGLAQQRVGACEFDIAVVTNITHEHLDYHGSFEAYRASKGLLFADLDRSPPKQHGVGKVAVLNADDPSCEYLSGLSKARKVKYSMAGGGDVRAAQVREEGDGVRFVIHGPGYRRRIRLHLMGAYNVANALAAFSATVEGLGLDPDAAARGLEDLESVPGRMERIDMGQPFLAIVDFAHTPNALRRALMAARRMVDGRVIAVFGSAGLRDRAKRGLMARVSAEMADLTVLTAEDPRTESLQGILEEMAQAARQMGGREGVDYWVVPDRGEAIRLAVRMAQAGDLVIACGKGHEQSMCFGEVEYPWDDRVAMRAALAELLGLEGPAMPRLPTSSR